MKKFYILILAICICFPLMACERSKSINSVEEVLQQKKYLNKTNIEQTIIVDEPNLKITATEMIGNCLSLEMVNLTNRPLMVCDGDMFYSKLSCNGYNFGWKSKHYYLKPNERRIELYDLPIEELINLGFEDLFTIEMSFCYETVNHESIYLKPVEIKTLAYEKEVEVDAFANFLKVQFDHVDVFENKEIYHQNDVVIEGYALTSNDRLILNVRNDSDQEVYLKPNNIRFNDILAKTNFYERYYIGAHKKTLLVFEFNPLYSHLFDRRPASLAFDLEMNDLRGYDLVKPIRLTFEVKNGHEKLDFSGTDVYQKAGLRIHSFGYLSEYKAVVLYIENKTKEDFIVDELSGSGVLNGQNINVDLESLYIPSGDVGMVFCRLEHRNIHEVESLKFSINLLNPKSNEKSTCEIVIKKVT